MEFVLEVRPPKGDRFFVPLPASGTVTVGREAPADLVITDNFLSRSHFQILCEDMIHIFTDKGSSNGTYLNGVRLRQAVLKPRDAIFAGRTCIRIAAVVDGKVALDTLPASAGEMPPPQGKVIAALEAGCNFVVLDGAINPAVRDLLNQAGVFYQSLYEGEQSGDLAVNGPYLAEVQGGKLLPFLVKVGWGNSWGVFLNTKMDFAETRKHLRHFLIVSMEGGKQALFRFYDPRVMRIFLPTCSAEQRKDFFGNIEEIFVESEKKTSVLRYTAGANEEFQLE